MKDLIKKAVLAFAICMVATGCKVAQEESVDALSIDPEQESLEAVVDTFEKASEDFSEELEGELAIDSVSDSILEMTAESAPENTIDIEEERSDRLKYCLFPAHKRMCVSNGERSAKFSRFHDCLIKGTRFLAEGHVKLTYNNAFCSLKKEAASVNRTYDLKLTKIFRLPLSYTVKSADAENYEGKILGGGELVEKTEQGWMLSINGRHIKKFHARKDRPVASLSLETLKPLQITGTLKRPGRKITEGQVVVYHNLAKFKTTYTAQNLAWSSDCKCPISGTLDIDVSGSIEGGGQIEFNSCGQATMTRDNGNSSQKELPNCLIDEVE